MHLGGAAAGRSDRLHRVDARRPPAPPALPRPARRQTSEGGGARMADELVTAGRRSIPISHPDRIVFPPAKATKLDLARHYAAVGPVMVPHVRERPLAVQSFPRGSRARATSSRTRPSTSPTGSTRSTVPKREGGSHPPGARQRPCDARLPGGPERDHAPRLDEPRRPARAARPDRLRSRPGRAALRRDPGRRARLATCCATSGSSLRHDHRIARAARRCRDAPRPDLRADERLGARDRRRASPAIRSG